MYKRKFCKVFFGRFSQVKCGCSSVVEHLLAKEDVASSSLVTRSSLRFKRSGKRKLERVRRSRARQTAPRLKLRLASQHMFYVYFLRSQSHQEQIYTGLTTTLRARLSNTIPTAPSIAGSFCPGCSLPTSPSQMKKPLPHSKDIQNQDLAVRLPSAASYELASLP